MRILAADDELLALEMLSNAIKKASPDSELNSFSKPSELLAFAKQNPADVAFLDIHMRGMTGVELAKKLKDLCPKINIIFVTGYEDYKGDTMDLRASGYILKPVTKEQIEAELSDLRYPVKPQKNALIKAKCFGNFDVFTPDGNLINFERQKSKELLAYLISKHGTTCTIKEIAAALFEDMDYDRKQRGYVQKIISSMISTLKSVGAESVIIKNYNSVSVDPALIDCDYYRFENLDPSAVNSYNGEFMLQYPWAEFIVGYLESIYYKN